VGNQQWSAEIRERAFIEECDAIHRNIAMCGAIGHRILCALGAISIMSLTACGDKDTRRIVQELGVHAYGASLIHPKNLEFPAGLSISRFNGNHDRQVFSDLGASRPSRPPSTTGVLYKLTIWKNLRTPNYEFDYEPVSGRIRFRGEWLQVPQRLQERLNSEIKRAEDAARAGRPNKRSAPGT
jgi:hypothetical protein